MQDMNQAGQSALTPAPGWVLLLAHLLFFSVFYLKVWPRGDRSICNVGEHVG